MNNNLTELVYIVDMSGSMSGLTNDTINGYNNMLEEQRKLSKENSALKANVTTVFFDDRYIMVHDREDLDKVKNITDKEYSPLGMTAMLDAVGRTIVSVGQKLAATPEEERPGLVSVTIITDGQENYSKEYTWDKIQDMIKEQREKYSWLFTFIGANIDTERTAESMGIDKNMTATWTCTTDGINTVYTSLNNATLSARNCVATSGSIADAACYYSEAVKNINVDTGKHSSTASYIYIDNDGKISVGGYN